MKIKKFVIGIKRFVPGIKRFVPGIKRSVPEIKRFAPGLALMGVSVVVIAASVVLGKWAFRAFDPFDAPPVTVVMADGLPHVIYAEGVKNMRDCGGWMTRDGHHVRCGRLFRSAELNNVNPKNGKRNFTLPEKSRLFITQTLGIRTDIDLRNDLECTGMTTSPLGVGVTWMRFPVLAYRKFDFPTSKASFSRLFSALLDEQNYPALIHCRAGRDRCGSVVFLLNAILGVSEDDLRRDWEFSERVKGHDTFDYTRLDGLFAMLAAYPGKTVNDRAAAFIRSLGFTDNDLVRFRTLMLQ